MMYLLFSFVAATVLAQLGDVCTEKRTDPMDVMFVVDGSTSIGKHDPSEWPGMLRFIKQLIKGSINVEGDRVGIWQFAWEGNRVGKIEHNLGEHTVEHIVDTVQDMVQLKGKTPTLSAVSSVTNKFWEVQPQFEGRQRLMVIITDGYPTCDENMCQDPCVDFNGNARTYVRENIDKHNIKVVVIGIDNDAKKLECLVEDPEVNIVEIKDFHSFQEYRDPTGDDNLLCVNPKELELKCCRVAVTSYDYMLGNDLNCQKKNHTECLATRGTGEGSCEWGITFEKEFIDGCGVTTYRPTPEPTLKPTYAPTTCQPLNNCIVKGGVKVFGWPNAGGKVKASSACACSNRCAANGGTEAKWHTKRKICKCWKSSTHIEMQQVPFEPNAQHGGNAGGKTQCVKIAGSSADITTEVQVTITDSPTAFTPTAIPTPAPTPIPTPFPSKAPTNPVPTPQPTTLKSTMTEAQWKAMCDNNKKLMDEFMKNEPYSKCWWVDAICDFRCSLA